VTTTFQIDVQNTLKFYPETSDKGLSKIQSMWAKATAETERARIKVLFGLSLNWHLIEKVILALVPYKLQSHYAQGSVNLLLIKIVLKTV